MRLKISSNTVKISGFGSFYKKVTPARVGRNPKTKEEHNSCIKKPVFKASAATKKYLIELVGMAGFEPTTTTPPV